MRHKDTHVAMIEIDALRPGDWDAWQVLARGYRVSASAPAFSQDRAAALTPSMNSPMPNR